GGGSRMAAIMWTRLMGRLVRATVRKPIRKPAANPLTRLVGVTGKTRPGAPSSAQPSKIRAVTAPTPRLTPPQHRARPRPPGPPAPEAGGHPRGGGDQRVHGALDHEAADQPAPAHADRPQHAQLGLALLGQHHEHVHQQHDPGDDGEAADEQEQGAELGPDGLGLVEQLALGGGDGGALAGQGPQGGLELAGELVGGGGPAPRPPGGGGPTARPWRARDPKAAWSLPVTWSVAAAPPSTPPALETRVRVSGPAPALAAATGTVPGATKAPGSPKPASPRGG